jgi:hypothetical protein
MQRITKERLTDEQRIAFQLLTGFCLDNSGRATLRYLSDRTTPTEKEAGAVLAKILLSDNVPDLILRALALLFDPQIRGPEVVGAGLPGRRIIFKNGRYKNPFVDAEIALRVHETRGGGYERAIGAAAEEFGKSTRQVARIYASYRHLLAAMDDMTSDKAVDVMTPDRQPDTITSRN